MGYIINTEMVFDGLNCTVSNDPDKYEYCVGMQEGYVMVQTVKGNRFARITTPIEIILYRDTQGFISSQLIRILNK